MTCIFSNLRSKRANLAKFALCPIAALSAAFLFANLQVCSAQNYGPLPPPNTLQPKTVWSAQNNQFVTSTLEDATGWWWGTDDDGLWHFAPDAKPGSRWQHFRAEDGLYDDSITALCVDRKGRLWVGTERRGVSVYNNSWWQNYDVMSGPLGAHVSSITINPVNGDIWITSESGIAIYSDTKKSWRYITRAEGLGTNDINCVAFLSNGEAIVGSADDGLFLSPPTGNYTVWNHIVTTPAAAASETGQGLSSNQINCLLVNKAGKIYCGTASGLCFSSDSGKTWSFLHGWMWQVKIKRQVRNSVPVNETGTVLPLSDDYISALAFDQNGFIYVGHNTGGVEVIDDSDGSQQYHTKLNSYGTYIRSLTLLSKGGLLIGNYGSGASIIDWTNAKALPETSLIKAHQVVTFPTPAESWSAGQITKIADQVKSALAPPKTITVLTSGAKSPGGAPAAASPAPPTLAPTTPPAPPVQTGYFLAEDWQTQGSWIGRYGREFAILCGADDANQDFMLGDQKLYSVAGSIGVSLNGSTTPSHWLQWEQSNDPRVLYDPEVHVRRESEWDDQGDQDQRQLEGPDIWLTVQVPAGTHRMSLYFMNKDGHTNVTRIRDFIVQLMPAKAGVDFHQTYDSPGILPVLAETRVENFWPGAFEQFVVTGPGSYYLKIDKNASLNTIVQAVFIDGLGLPGSTPNPTWMNGFNLISPSPAKAPHLSTLAAKAIGLWSDLDSLYGNPASAPFQRVYRIQLLRSAIAAKAPQSLLDSWRLQLGLWDDTDWSRFNHALARMTAISSVGPKP